MTDNKRDPFPAMLWTGNLLSDCWRYVGVTAAVSWKLFRHTLGRIAHSTDMKTLVVGQKVTIRSGPLFEEAFVEEVNEDSVLVFIPPTGNRNGWAIYFRYDGTQDGGVVAGGVFEPRPFCTDFGPWRLKG
jgi:hypothetical protein